MVTISEITNFQEVVPPHLQELVKAYSQEDLLFLGKASLGRMITFWRSVERAQTSQIEAAEEETWLLGSESDLQHSSKVDTFKRKQTVDSYIKLLVSLEQKAENKPLLSLLRPVDWFKLNDRVSIILADCCNIVTSDSFVFGQVVGVDPERFFPNNPTINVLTDVIFTDLDLDITDDDGNLLEKGRGFCCLYWQPWFMLKWEFEYFKSHPEFFRFWMSHFRHENLIISSIFTEHVIEALIALNADSPVAQS